MASTLALASPLPGGGDSADAITVQLPTTYTWDYAAKRQDLRNLYEKSKGAMWNAQRDLAWDTDVDPERENVPDAFIPTYGTELWSKLDQKTEVPKLRRLAASYMLSNFLHGELGALLATSQIVSAVPSADAKLYASTQAMDEARHVEAYDRYLREKIGTVFPISPHLRQLLDATLSEPRWDMKYLGMQILIEGLALAAFGLIGQTTKEPLLKDILHRIGLDEARHVAFGVLSLRGVYGDMTESELKDREEFIVEASRLMRDRFLMQEVWEEMGMPVEACTRLALESETMKVFRQLLFSKIVPNVKRLGLLTPRVRKGFEELDVLHFEHLEPTA